MEKQNTNERVTTVDGHSVTQRIWSECTGEFHTMFGQDRIHVDYVVDNRRAALVLTNLHYGGGEGRGIILESSGKPADVLMDVISDFASKKGLRIESTESRIKGYLTNKRNGNVNRLRR